jgi:MFS transporter, Spinster family, sphingosine-1-phosphate transporter
VLPLLQAEFGVGDAAAGAVTSAFVIAYTVASPFTGVIGDRWPRRYLVGAGVLLWSLATVASGLAASFRQLLTARSFIGIGEAGFGAVAPTLISDLFPKERRSRMLAFFYVAIPVGSALGFLLGGYVGEHYGWRTAFFLAGGPGIALGLLAFAMPEPARGAGDGVVHEERRRFEWRALAALLRNSAFVFTTLGMAAMTFAMMGLATWMPTFFVRARGLTLSEAGTLFGGITVVGGLVGTFLGGWLGDYLHRRTKRAYLLVSGAGMLLAIPAAYVGLTAHDKTVYGIAMFVAEVFLFLNTGPANAVLVNVVLPEIRATAIALSIFVYHLIGDVVSPPLIGFVSDRVDPNHGPQGLETALVSLMLGAMAVSGILYLVGARRLEEDTAAVERTLAEREHRHAEAGPNAP